MTLEAVNVSKFYGSRQALDGVSFSVPDLETVGILGGAYSGKSTIMRLFSGYLAPTNGRVRVNGQDPRIPAARAGIGFLPVGTPLPPRMRVGEYLRFRAGLKGVFGKKEVRKAVDAATELCPATREVTDVLIGNLAPAARQWVGIADALLCRPDILLLDELASGLDAREAAEAWDLVLAAKGKATILVTSRSIDELERVCRRVVIIQRGGIMADGDLREFCAKTVEERTVVLTIISGEPVREAFRAIPGVRTVFIAPDPDNPGTQLVRVAIPPGVDLRRELAEVCADRGWLITGMRLEPIRLEDLFRRNSVVAGR